MAEKISKAVLALSRLGISPNAWTLLEFVPAFVAAYYLSQAEFLAAAILLLVSGFIDLVDGAVARQTGKADKFGAYLDSVADRYIEFIAVFGLLFAELPFFIFPAYVWLSLYVFGALMTGYANAAAKEKISVRVKNSFFGRGSRAVILFIGLIIASFNALSFMYILSAVAILANLSALHQVLIAVNSARKNSR